METLILKGFNEFLYKKQLFLVVSVFPPPFPSFNPGKPQFMYIQHYSLNRITPYPQNPRHNAQAVNKVAASIDAFGFKQPIVVDKDHVIIVGHTRYLAARQLGLKEVPVLAIVVARQSDAG